MSNSVLDAVAEKILAIRVNHPVRVGINGVDGSGKTFLAKNLADALTVKTSRQVVLSSIDGFHHPRAHRYQKGRESAEGFYHDSFQYDAVRDELLVPLGVSGSRKYRTQVFDHGSDSSIISEEETAANDAILILEGLFLFRNEMRDELDYKIYLDVPFDVTLQRMLERDKDSFSSEAELISMFNARYRAGQELYMNDVRPSDVADVVIDNTDYLNPVIH